MRDLKETVKSLKEREKRADKKGYKGDATHYAFQRHLLILLSQIAPKKKKPSSWNMFVSTYLKQGKTIKEAAKDWKHRNEKG